MHRVVAVALFVLGTGVAFAEQKTEPAPAAVLQPGRWVRVQSDGSTVVGTLVEITATTVRLKVKDDSVTVPVRDITSLEASSHPPRGSLIGSALPLMVVGAGVGAVVGVKLENDCVKRSTGTGGMCIVPLVGMAPLGAGLGLGLAALLRAGQPEPVWEPVVLDRVRVGVLPYGRGLALSLTF